MAAEPLLSFQDVTTIMSMITDIKDDVGAIRRFLEEEETGQEEEDPEANG